MKSLPALYADLVLDHDEATNQAKTLAYLLAASTIRPQGRAVQFPPVLAQEITRIRYDEAGTEEADLPRSLERIVSRVALIEIEENWKEIRGLLVYVKRMLTEMEFAAFLDKIQEMYKWDKEGGIQFLETLMRESIPTPEQEIFPDHLSSSAAERGEDDELNKLMNASSVSLSNGRFIYGYRYIKSIQSAMERDRRPQSVKKFIYNNLFFVSLNYSHWSLCEERSYLIANHFASDKEDEQTFFAILLRFGADGLKKFIEAAGVKAGFQHPVYLLYEWVNSQDQAPSVVLGRKRSGRHLIYANICCWGDSYIRLADRALLPSLLAPGNVPALAWENDVVLEFVTMSGDVEKLSELTVLKELAKHCEIRIVSFPDAVEREYPKLEWKFFSYILLGFGFHFTLLRAIREGADIMTMMSDFIFSDGALKRVAEQVTREPRALITEALNSSASGVLHDMAPYRRPDELHLSLPPRALSQSMVKRLMPRTTVNFHDRDRSSFPAFPMNFLFPEENGLVLHKLHSTLLYASHTAFSWMRQFNYNSSDGYFTYHVLSELNDDQIVTFATADDPVIVELCDEVGILHPNVERPFKDVLAQAFLAGDVGHGALKLLARERVYHFDHADVPGLLDPAERLAFIRDLKQFVSSDPIFTELAVLRRPKFATGLVDIDGAVRVVGEETKTGAADQD